MIQCVELWLFVGNKDNKQWIWLALDVNRREIVEIHVVARSRYEPEIVAVVAGCLPSMRASLH